MTRKRKREKRERDRQANLARPIVDGVVLPAGAIPADLSRQAPNNSYSPLLYYVDQAFTCVDCGAEEVWTAEQQQWYFEEAKGPIQARAIRCRACRRKRREQLSEQRRKSGHGDPNPIKHEAVLLARVREAIEPALVAASFRFSDRNNPRTRYGQSRWIDYVRSGETFSIRWDRDNAGLAAELMDSQGRVEVVAEFTLDQVRSTKELLGRVTPFVAQINRFLGEAWRSHEQQA